MRTKTWIAVLEVTGGDAGVPMDVGALRALLDALADASPRALHDAGRYALQLQVHAATPAEAVFVAVARWHDATRGLGFPEWDVVRAEVMTPEELEREFSVIGDERPLSEAATGRPEAVPAGEPSADDLLRHALHDSVTNLATREVFLAQVREALELAQALGTTPAVVVLDLDDFEAMTDEVGQVGGDQVLNAVARRVVHGVRNGDVTARLDGDRFGILLQDGPEECSLDVAQRLVDAVASPLRAGGREVTASASAGVAVCGPGHDAEALVRNAGEAARAAKSEGRGRCQLYEPSDRSSRREQRDRRGDVVHDRLGALLLLQRAAVAANEASTLEEAVRVVLDDVCRLTDWPLGHLFRVDDRGNRLVSTSTWRQRDADRYRHFREETEKTSFSRGEGLPGRVLANGRATWITDVAEDDNFPRRDAALACGIRAAFAFPVLVGAEVVAVLEFFGDQPVEPNPALLDVMVTVGTQLGRVVERTRAETAVRRSEEHFRALAQSASDAIISVDDGGAIVSWNDAAERMFGYSEPEILGRPLECLIAEQHREPHWRSVRQLLDDPGNRTGGRRLETEALRSDGIEVPVEMSLSTWETSEGTYGTVIVRTVTERKPEHGAVRESETPSRGAQSLDRTGSWRWDVRRRRGTWSPEMYRLFGIDPSRSCPSPEDMLAAIHPDDRHLARADLERVLRSGGDGDVRFRIVRPPSGGSAAAVEPSATMTAASWPSTAPPRTSPVPPTSQGTTAGWSAASASDPSRRFARSR